MQEIGTINKLSNELKKLIIPLRPGDIVQYQRTVFHECNELNPDMSKRKTRVYPHVELFIHDTIFDPWAGDLAPDNKPVGALIDIGIPAKGGINRKEGTVALWERFTLDRSTHGGIFILDGKVAIHRELHEFFQLSSLNTKPIHGEKYRSADVEAILFLLDPKKESVQKNKVFKIKKDLLLYVDLMGVEEMREFAAGKNWEYTADADVLQSMIQEHADKFPELMTREISDPTLKQKALIKYALSEQRIGFDPVQYRILWPNGNVCAQLERVKDQNEIDAFATFLETAANGSTILKQLSKKNKVAATTD